MSFETSGKFCCFNVAVATMRTVECVYLFLLLFRFSRRKFFLQKNIFFFSFDLDRINQNAIFFLIHYINIHYIHCISIHYINHITQLHSCPFMVTVILFPCFLITHFFHFVFSATFQLDVISCLSPWDTSNFVSAIKNVFLPCIISSVIPIFPTSFSIPYIQWLDYSYSYKRGLKIVSSQSFIISSKKLSLRFRIFTLIFSFLLCCRGLPSFCNYTHNFTKNVHYTSQRSSGLIGVFYRLSFVFFEENLIFLLLVYLLQAPLVSQIYCSYYFNFFCYKFSYLEFR